MKENLKKATRLVPCSVVLLSVGTEERQDAMTATAMFVSENPPLFTVSVAKHIVSHDLIEKAGEFALNVASADQVELAKKLGYTHGRDVDKFKEFNIQTQKATKISAPLINGSFATIECKVITSLTAANYSVYLAEVVAYTVNEEQTPVVWLGDKYFPLKDTV